MKKLKIFLLLGILLCFGFALSPEVHAQGSGPKLFEVDDVLPQGLVKITGKFYTSGEISIRLNDIEFIYKADDVFELEFLSPFNQYLVEDNTDYSSRTINAIFDFSDLTESERTVSMDYYHSGNVVYWEEYIAGYSITYEEYGGTTQTDLTEQTALPDPLPIPTKENHTFVGWYYGPDFINEAFANDPLTDDVILYARWSPGKLFEVDDVLPATTALKIRILFVEHGDYHVETDDPNGIYLTIDWIGGVKDYYLEIGGVLQHDGVTSADEIYYTIDISNWSSSQRTIKSVSSENGIFVTWEDLNAPTEPSSGYTITFEENGGTEQTDLSDVTTLPDPLPTPTKTGYTFVGWYYDSDFFDDDKAFAGDPLTDDVILYARWLPGKLFEKDEVLPATIELEIRILFEHSDYYHVETVDPSGIYLSIDWIDGVKDYYLEIGGVLQHDGVTSADEIYYTIDISNWSSNQRTIKSVSSDNGIFVTWEDATPEGYTQGYLDAREEFGYYDSRTNQWLSVDEYLDLYGTDKPGQSDFYGNFDKYFIPAMIIVFGGAIVLTVLKVFKGRE